MSAPEQSLEAPADDRQLGPVIQRQPAVRPGGRFVDRHKARLTLYESWPAAGGEQPSGRHRTFAGDARGFVLRRLLAVSDLLTLTAAAAAAGAFTTSAGSSPVSGSDLVAFGLCLPLWLLVASAVGLYHLSDRRLGPSTADEIGPVIFALSLWSWAFLMIRAALDGETPSLLGALAVWVIAVPLLPAARALTRALSRRRAWYEQRVAVVGTSGDVSRVVRRLDRHPELALKVACRVEVELGPSVIDPIGLIPPSETDDDPGFAERLSRVVAGAVERARINRVIVASAPGDMDERSELIRALTDLRVHVDLVSADSDAIPSRGSLHYMEGLPLLTIAAVRTPRSRAVVKRAFDLTAASTGLLLIWPLLLYCSIRIRLQSPGTALFHQERVGVGGKRFQMLKFRTMFEDAEVRKRELSGLNFHARGDTPGMFKIPGDPRITRFGAWLRRWSVDELPQLWNVIRGDMSLVGPRPLIPEEASLVNGRHQARLSARPGITGPWQTLGRSDIGFEDMVKLDYTYVTNPSFAEDLKLLMRTIGAVVRRNGAY